MCLILFGYQVSTKYPVILAANRDEFYHRPTAAMHFWDSPHILAGKDLEQGGTWFGVHKNGCFAALTNYRDPASLKQNAPSRGEIIVDLLESDQSMDTYFDTLNEKPASYNGFNLLFGSKENLFWFSNLTRRTEQIKPGIHGLSNKFLNTPWPKVEKGRKAMGKMINTPFTPDDLFTLLTDRSAPDDTQLPDTGVGLEWERRLSPLFIQSDVYGTRSSIVMLMDQTGEIFITERTWDMKDISKFIDQKFHIFP